MVMVGPMLDYGVNGSVIKCVSDATRKYYVACSSAFGGLFVRKTVINGRRAKGNKWGSASLDERDPSLSALLDTGILINGQFHVLSDRQRWLRAMDLWQLYITWDAGGDCLANCYRYEEKICCVFSIIGGCRTTSLNDFLEWRQRDSWRGISMTSSVGCVELDIGQNISNLALW